MSDSRLLLERIRELRERLESGRVGATPATAEPADAQTGSNDRVLLLKKQVRAGLEESTFLAQSVKQLVGHAAPSTRSSPTQLTGRARRMLEDSRDLLSRLRALNERVEAQTEAGGAETALLAGLYREVAAMFDACIRTARNLPAAALDQFRLCDGLEPAFATVDDRLAVIEFAVSNREQEQGQVKQLASLLLNIDKNPSMEHVIAQAEQVLGEADNGVPLRVLHAPPENPPQYVACHSLNVARVMARVLRHQPEMRDRRALAIVAALIHDAGMIEVPVEILAQAGPLTDAQKRVVEAHCRRGAELAEKLLPSGTWLRTAVVAHHERLDGTGYPSGLQNERVDALTRLLTVCDVYAAMCAPRPHRPAHDPRQAITGVLELADNGIVDRHHAECLLHLGFYPVGTVVELADGALACVVACHTRMATLQAPARPVIMVLTDGNRHLLPVPHFVDLSQTEGQSIVRALPQSERIDCLGYRYPQWI